MATGRRFKTRQNWQPRSLKRWGWLLAAIAVWVIHFSPVTAIAPQQLPASQYASTITAPFNQPSHYPAQQTLPSNLYRPVAPWVGRLILPTVAQYQQFAKTTAETDWAWFEVHAAPANAQNLVGQKVRLAWSKTPVTQRYVQVVTRDVQFTPEAETDFQYGVINPIRLNGRAQVGPLQSLAGGHPYDDVTVQLWGKVAVETAGKPQPTNGTSPSQKSGMTIQSLSPAPQTLTANPLVTLRINREPLQNTGRFYTLVKFLQPAPPTATHPLPAQCPGGTPCTSDLMRVQHYNPKTRRFDGAVETIRIPQQPADGQGIFNFTTRALANSPAGKAGWYVYGAADQQGLFTATALKPRSLVQLPAQTTILGFNRGLQYINYDNWKDLEPQQGTLQTVLVDAQATDPAAAQAQWSVGTQTLFMHNYGGRGGNHKHHESYVAGTYAGHFSFGIAEVVVDPFTDEPIFDVNYFQVYGNGGDGTLSGGQTWAHYMGNLRRGFMGTRPVSDTLINLPALTQPYTFGDTQLSFFNELIGELSLVGARYRIGDGSGNSTITSATSCVQDSAQALFMTLQRFKQQIESNPQVIKWMRQHPDDPNTQRFKQLVKVAGDLAEQLTPMGVVRWDWQQNANILTGIESNQPFLSIDNFQLKNLLTGLISWRTAVPRQSHDEFAMLFLNQGGSLWFLRTNIIGGSDPSLAPLEPTLLLGAWKLPGTQVPLASWLVIRTFGGVTIPTGWDWLITLGVFAGFGAIALLVGFSQGILQWHPWQAPWYRQVGRSCRLLLVPALVQEYLFRVLLIPYPKDWLPAWHWWGWAALALGAFVGYQWLSANYIRRSRWLVAQPVGLLLITLLGLASTLTYRLTGSLWTITLGHWALISIWWLLLEGWQHAQRAQNKYAEFS